MSVGVLLVTHGGVGPALIGTAEKVLGALPLRVAALDVPPGADLDATLRECRRLRASLDTGDGMLVLSDLCGSTPFNLGRRLCEEPATRMVCGVNLPMLLKVMNYCQLDLDALAEKALLGGRQSIIATEA